MAETLVQEYYTWSGSLEIGAMLENASILRKVQLPSNWVTVKISARCILSSSLTEFSIAGTPRLYLGLGSGSNVLGDATVDYFFGFRTTDTSWGYTSSSFTTYYSIDSAQAVVFNGGSTPVSISADLWSAAGYIGIVGPSSHAVFKAGNMAIMISRSINQDIWRIQPCIPSVNWGKTGFLRDLQVPEVSTYHAQGAIYTFSASAERGNTLDTVVVAWDKENPSPAMMILDVGVACWPD